MNDSLRYRMMLLDIANYLLLKRSCEAAENAFRNCRQRILDNMGTDTIRICGQYKLTRTAYKKRHVLVDKLLADFPTVYPLVVETRDEEALKVEDLEGGDK